ncbi:hypothetical protein G7Z17_g158 [Cylindrodendrum hubeiense]|uniref:DNA2/NAM7 helicase-like C-terminal domain-containing protein n=1 Tax=Cylindrodendrum hubeiense TaxID=595255 RepID=A0A9P5LLG7_9HYPO|nr:hypothetical protein G7Z17_g158 [Cylindrodendrum hubeiense]
MSQSTAASASGQPQGKKAIKTYVKPCAIMVGSLDGVRFGGKGLGMCTDIATNIMLVNSADTAAWTGFNIEFPLGQSNEEDGFGVCHTAERSMEFRVEPTDLIQMSVKFPRGLFTYHVEPLSQASTDRFPGGKSKMTIVEVVLKDNAHIEVDGYGMPFANTGHACEKWLHYPRTALVADTEKALLAIIEQRRFIFIVNQFSEQFMKSWSPDSLPPPFTYPYGVLHEWNEERYLSMLEKNKGHQFEPAWGYDDDNSHFAVVTQSQVQDVMWLYQVSLDIAKEKLLAYFIEVESSDSTYFVVLPSNQLLPTRYDAAWRRLSKKNALTLDVYEDDEKVPVSWEATIQDHADAKELFQGRHPLKKTDLVLFLTECERKVNAVCQYHPQAPPSNPLVFGTPAQGEKGSVSPELAFRMAVHRDLVRGKGFWKSLRAVTTDSALSSALDHLDLDLGDDATRQVPSPLPMVNILKIEDQDYIAALMREALPDDRERFRKYLSARPLGLGIITAGPGFGKTTALALATLGMAASFGHIYGTAPTHVATDNFAARLDAVTTRVTQRYNHDKAVGNPTYARRKLIVRVYKEQDEFDTFRSLLRNPHAGDDAAPSSSRIRPSKWRLFLSPSFWLLACLRSPAVRDFRPQELHLDDSIALHALQETIDQRGELSRLREVASGKITWEEYTDGKTVTNDQITSLLHAVIAAADILCSPPALAHTHRVASVWKNRKAKGIAVDEAANMVRPDLYSVWGNTLLPCILAGDDKQLGVVISTRDEVDILGNYLNRFAKDGKISPLEWFKGLGWPVYRLRTQLRMAVGQFDICHSQVYSDIPFTYGPGCNIDLPSHEIGRALEQYVTSKYPEVKAAPASTLQPVFIHCEDAFCITDPNTGSKKSLDQVKIALDFLIDFGKVTGANLAQVVIMTPYSANLEAIDRLRRKPKYSSLAAIRPAATVDSFQGQEGDLSVVIMATNRNTGPGFTTEARRLNVMMSRQKSGLILVGDIKTSKNFDKGSKGNKGPKGKTTIQIEDAEGDIHWANATMLANVHAWMVDNHRYLTVKIGKPKVL